MVALSACPGHREVVVWASYCRRGRSGSAIGLTKFPRQSAVRAQHGPCCSHTEEHFFWYLATIRWSGGFLRSPWSQRGRRPVWRGLKPFVFSFTIQFETWRLFCLRHNHYTQVIYCGPHKMTAILQTNLKCIFLHGNCCIFLEISFKFENILDNFVNYVLKYLSWMETFAVFIHINFFSNCWLKSASIYAADLGSSRRQAIICRLPN